MKPLLALLLFALPAFAQTATPVAAPGCGSENYKFDVKTDKGRHPQFQPDSSKALLYFIEDDSNFESIPKPTTRIGLNGQWIGATHGNSYFSVSVDPGEHHLCAGWQTAVLLGQDRKVAALHFIAEPGQIYFFRVKNFWVNERSHGSLNFEPIDSDEGQLLANKFALSTYHPKK